MRTIGKAAAAAAMVVALLVAGALAFVRSPGETPQVPARTAITSTLLVPAVAAGSLDGTIASLQVRLKALPQDWRGYASLGLAYVAQARVTGDPSWYPKAEGVFARSIRLNGDGNVEGTLGRYDRAFDAFQTMVDTRPDLASYARVAYARELVGDVRGAERAMRMAFDAAGTPSDSAWSAYQLGELAFGSGHVASAREWYRRGLGLDPSYVPNLAGLAKVAWASGDDELAIARYTDVVARYPSAEFVVALADLYRVTGQADLADQQEAVVDAMHRLATANGVNVDLELALFDADHGDPAGALTAARAEWARRQSVHVADAYAWALYANGRYARAASLEDRALALGTRSALFLYHAGMIRLELGDEAGARRYLSRALATNPNFSILHAADAARVLSDLRPATLETGR
jgi:tetratricopeptide (TPR) repeat protein